MTGPISPNPNATHEQQRWWQNPTHIIQGGTLIFVGLYTILTAVILILSVVQYGEIHRFDKSQREILSRQLFVASQQANIMQAQADIAAKQASIMQAQADISTKQVADAEHAFLATARPWIVLPTISNVSLAYNSEGTVITALATFKNTGQSPAINGTITFHLLQTLNGIAPSAFVQKHD